VGCGKSTLSRVFIFQLEEEKYDTALVINPSLPADELLYEIAAQLGVSPPTAHRSAIFRALNEHLLLNAQRGKSTVLILDEAHTINDQQVFEDLRMILNFQLNDRYLLTVLLLGQPDLRELVARQSPLDQRIALRLNLGPLNEQETAFYITFQLKAAGRIRRIFTNEAIMAIHRHSKGIPRSINNLCDLCLLEGMRVQAREVDLSLVKTVLALT
jgi:general secretion pathway protein A